MPYREPDIPGSSLTRTADARREQSMAASAYALDPAPDIDGVITLYHLQHLGQQLLIMLEVGVHDRHERRSGGEDPLDDRCVKIGAGPLHAS